MPNLVVLNHRIVKVYFDFAHMTTGSERSVARLNLCRGAVERVGPVIVEIVNVCQLSRDCCIRDDLGHAVWKSVRNETGTDLVSIASLLLLVPARPTLRRAVCWSPSDLTILRVQASSP